MTLASALLRGNVHCPKQLAPDLEKLRARREQGPVVAASQDDRRAYVFVITPPLYGSTALFGLLATSPNVGTLCTAAARLPGGAPNCEGQYILQHEGLMPPKERYSADFPRNWSQAEEAFEPFWDKPDAPLLLEKSPSNVFKTAHIAADLVNSGREVDFVVMSRSPCFVDQLEWRVPILHADFSWAAYAELLVAAQHRPNTRALHIRYEDFVQDPYGTAEEILAFLPALQQLDPARNPIHALGAKVYGESPKEMYDKASKNWSKPKPDTDRAKSVVDYVLEKRTLPAKRAVVDGKLAKLMAELGYAT